MKPKPIAAAGKSATLEPLLRLVANTLSSHLSRRAVICAVLAGFQVFASGYFGHLPNSKAAVILASPIIEPQRPSHVVVIHEEAES